MQCPACGSSQVATKNHARRIGSAVGGAAGVAGGVTGRQAGEYAEESAPSFKYSNARKATRQL